VPEFGCGVKDCFVEFVFGECFDVCVCGEDFVGFGEYDAVYFGVVVEVCDCVGEFFYQCG